MKISTLKWSRVQKKTCRKKQHVKIDDMKEMSDLICGIVAVGGNYNSTHDNEVFIRNILHNSKFFLIISVA